MEEKSILIHHLFAENMMGLKLVDIEFPREPGVVFVTGKNGAGKTSVEDLVKLLLAGQSEVAEPIIREGAKAGESEMTLSNGMKIRVRKTAKSDRIELTNGDGEKIKGPREFLAGLWDATTCDALSAMRLGETPEGRRKRKRILMKMCGLDPEAIDCDKAALYEERKRLNWKVDAAKKALRENPNPNGDIPKEAIDTQKLAEAIEHAAQQNEQRAGVQRAIEKMRHEISQGASQTQDCNRSILDAETALTDGIVLQREAEEAVASLKDEDLAVLSAEIDRIEKMLHDARQQYEAASRRNQGNASTRAAGEKVCAKMARLAERVDAAHQDRERVNEFLGGLRERETALTSDLRALAAVDIEALRQKHANAVELNGKLEAAARHFKADQEHLKAVNESQELTCKLAALEQRIDEALKTAKMPLDGVAFTDDDITINGVPFERCAQNERLKMSVRLAFAGKPQIRVALLDNANDLDSDAMRIIAEEVQAQGGQLIAAKVDESGAVGIYLEAGEVKSNQYGTK